MRADENLEFWIILKIIHKFDDDEPSEIDKTTSTLPVLANMTNNLLYHLIHEIGCKKDVNGMRGAGVMFLTYS